MTDILPCREAFQRGQVWKNPDDELMMIVSVCEERGKIEYITQDGERGSFYASDKAIVDNIEQVITRPSQSNAPSVPEDVAGVLSDLHFIMSWTEDTGPDTEGKLLAAERRIEKFIRAASKPQVEVVTEYKITETVSQCITEVMRQRPNADIKDAATKTIVEFFKLFKSGVKIIPAPTSGKGEP